MGKEIYFARIGDKCTMRAAPDDGDGKQQVSGVAMRFESPTLIGRVGGVGYYEVIDPAALDECDLSDVVFDRGHAMEDKVLARTTNGTLKLSFDANGLAFTADIIDTQEGKDTFKLIKRGDVHQCSFAATIREDSYDEKTHTYRILKIDKLYDVAAVTFPAYQDTNVSALRSRFKIGEKGKPGENPQKAFELAKAKNIMSL